MKLVSMKKTRSDVEAQAEKTVAADAPAYPWGLSINLDDDSLEKLGIDKLPDQDALLTLTARVQVTSTSTSSYVGDKKKHRSVGLQITAMALGPNQKDKADEDVLYEGKD